MTNEEAVKMLKAKRKCLIQDVSGVYDDCNRKLCNECYLNYEQGNMGQQAEYLRMSIEALEQEPCEDCISRQAVMNCFKKWQPYMATRLFGFEKELSSLPSVTSQPKTGHWNTYVVYQNGIDEEWLECSECKWSNALLIPRNYCPNCGCRMGGSE